MPRKYRRFYFSLLGRFPGVGLPEMVVFHNYKRRLSARQVSCPEKARNVQAAVKSLSI
jgi:hypothetical protein